MHISSSGAQEDIELEHGGVVGAPAGHLPEDVPGGHAEPAGAADDGELAHGCREVVAAHDRHRAAVVGEHEVHGQQQGGRGGPPPATPART